MYLSHTYGSNKKRYHEVDPDEVFADAANISKFDGDVLEGKFEKASF